VIDRLQDQDMRQAVVDVAERLVRDEINRIKRPTASDTIALWQKAST
jgi:hypothetical protein